MEFITEFLPLIMFAVVFALLLLGFPVAFTIGGVAMAFGLYGFGPGFFDLLPMRIWGTMENFSLMAVPLFIYMGVMLEKSGLAEELLEAMALVFGRIKGGLAVSVIFVGALMGASTGIVGATVVTMGLLSVPTMLRNRYNKCLTTGTVAASGTLGQIMEQKWIASWTAAAESWFDWRRTGYPQLRPGKEVKRDAIPLRFYYSVKELDLNRENCEVAIDRLEETSFSEGDGKNSAWSKMWLLQGTGNPY